MSWNPITSPVDYYLLEGKKSPGISEVAGAGSPRKWDEVGGYGLSGSTLRFTGLGLAKFEIRTRLYTPEDFEAWKAFAVVLAKPPPKVRPRAKDIWHPFLEELGIKSVVIEDVLQPEQTGDGEWTLTGKFIQYRRPRITLAKPDGSKAAETDPYEQEIARNSEKIAGLRDDLAKPAVQIMNKGFVL